MARNLWDIILEIPTKHAPFGGATGDWDIEHEGNNWSAAAFVLAVANQEGGTPLFTLTNATAGSQGVSATYEAGMIDGDTGLVVGGTRIRPQVNESTLEAISWTPTDKPLSLFWDLLITPSGGVQFSHSCGNALLYSGVGD